MSAATAAVRASVMRAAAAVGGFSLLVATVAALVGPAPLTAGSIVLLVLVPLYAAGLIAWRHAPDHPVSLMLLAGGAGNAAKIAFEYTVLRSALADSAAVYAAAVTAVIAVDCLLVVVFVRLVALVPDGRYHNRYERTVLRLLWAYPSLPLLTLATGTPVYEDPRMFDTPGRALLLLGPAMLAARYAREPRHRPAIRWIWLACVAWCLGYLLVALPVTVGLVHVGDRIVVLQWLDILRILLVSCAVLVATFRHRLFDVDVAIRRSVVYGACWLAIGAVYIAAAAVLGVAANERMPIVLAVLATVAATIVLQPLRVRLDVVAQRLILGRRPDPHELFARFGSVLDLSDDPDVLAPRLAAALRDGLGLDAVLVRLGPARGVAGRAERYDGELPLRHGGDELGTVSWAGRLTPADRRLLAGICRQAALTVHNTLMAAELRASRARIVRAQDTARRGIERRLHDGVQQELVALVAKLRLARNRLGRGDDAGELVAQAQDDAGRLIAELRDIAHGIHPPVLADHGLIAAVEAQLRRFPVPATLHVSPPVTHRRYDQVVEESAFFFVTEALANVLKHAAAGSVDVRIEHAAGLLRVEVADDGTGFDPNDCGGSRLVALRDRVGGAGGDILIHSAPGRGTTVTARLPATRAPRREPT